MKLLTVGTIRDRWEPGSISPDLPDGVPFVGYHDTKTGTYLVAVPDGATVSAKAGRAALSTRKAQTDAISARGALNIAANNLPMFRLVWLAD